MDSEELDCYEDLYEDLKICNCARCDKEIRGMGQEFLEDKLLKLVGITELNLPPLIAARIWGRP